MDDRYEVDEHGIFVDEEIHQQALDNLEWLFIQGMMDREEDWGEDLY